MEIYIFFGLAIFGIGWLIGNYTSEREKIAYTMFIVDSLIANKFLRTHRVEVIPKVWITHVIRWDTPDHALNDPKKLESWHEPISTSEGKR
jgi:hypothetical protein